MRETQLQKLHLHLDTMCLNPKIFILLFFQENTKLSDFRLIKIPSQVTHYTYWQSMSDHLQVSVTTLQQILYNVLSHFNGWELYFIYTYISASFIPWNIFKSSWLLYSITIPIYQRIITPVCQQEILYNTVFCKSHLQYYFHEAAISPVYTQNYLPLCWWRTVIFMQPQST